MQLTMTQTAAQSRAAIVFWASISLLLFTNFASSDSALANDLETNPYCIEFLHYAQEPGKTFVEVFVTVPVHRLQFTPANLVYRARYDFTVSFLDEISETIQMSSYIDSVDAQASAAALNVNPPWLRYSFVIQPGEYRVEFKLTDRNSSAGSLFYQTISVPDFGGNDLKISDLQLSKSMARSDESSVLVKNNWKILPNISHEFKAEDKHLNVYAEVYNLNFRLDRVNRGFISSYFIRDERDCDVVSIEEIHQKPAAASVLTARLPIHELKSGMYKLVLRVRDLDRAQVVEKSTTFRMVNPVVL